ncbi:MAG: acyl carrier protein [Mycobacterium sp.]
MTSDSITDYEDLVGWLTAKVADCINEGPEMVDVNTALADLGIDSAASLGLCADLEYEKGITVETTILWDHPTIDAIATHLTDRASR